MKERKILFLKEEKGRRRNKRRIDEGEEPKC